MLSPLVELQGEQMLRSSGVRCPQSHTSLPTDSVCHRTLIPHQASIPAQLRRSIFCCHLQYQQYLCLPLSMSFVAWNTSSAVTVDLSPTSAVPLLSYGEALYWWAAYPFLIFEAVFFGLSFLFAAFDFYLSPSALASHKLQPNRLPAQSQSAVAAYKQAVLTSVYNHCFGSIPTLTIFALVARQQRLSLSPHVVSWPVLLYQIVLLLAVEEVGFYYCHRLLHLPLFFRSIHSIHHSYTAPVAVAATHCHIVEHVLCNLLPMLAGVLLARANWFLYMGWCGLAVVNTVCVHSGYGWWVLMAANHDRHHSTNKCAFGSLGVLDWLHGTRYVDLTNGKKLACD